MKIKTIVIPALFVIMSGSVFAEFQYPSSDSADVTEAARANAKRQLHQESVVGVTNGVNQSAQFDKSRLLRCWQEGELIVAENGWDLIDSKGAALMTQGGKQMSVYAFGETFCMYLGD